MRILALESSCDETAVAVVDDGPRLLSNVIHTQVPTHARFGGGWCPRWPPASTWHT